MNPISFNFGQDFSLDKSSALDTEQLYDMLIIGGGPAGLNAALYGKRKGLNVAILTKRKGGQVTDTSVVDNYLGLTDVSGEDLVHQFIEHLNRLEVPIVEGAEVINIRQEQKLHVVTLDSGKEYRTKTIILATGSNSRKLEIKGETAYAGRGVAYCAICDAPLFKGKDVFIAGGGNSAVEAALDLTKFANSVTLVHRSQFRADKILLDQLEKNPKISVHLQTKILEILGEEVMTGLNVLNLHTGQESILKGDGIFIEIGHVPNTFLVKDLVTLNDQGEIIVSERNETNIPGLFAAGDMTQIPYKQIIIATADGAKAALAASEYINQLILN